MISMSRRHLPTDEVSATETATAMQRELVALYGEIPTPRSWRADAVDGLLRATMVIVLLGIGAWYDFNRLAPGLFTMTVLGAYLSPPIVRAAIRYRNEAAWKQQQQQHLRSMKEQLNELPMAQLLTRLAAVTQTHHGGRITDVIEKVEALVAADESGSFGPPTPRKDR